MKNLAETLLEAYEDMLFGRYLEEEDNYIRKCIMDSVSPVIRIDYRNGISLSVNRDDYAINDIIRLTHFYNNEAAVYIDGRDIFDWE